jgi:hypothetical protein
MHDKAQSLVPEALDMPDSGGCGAVWDSAQLVKDCRKSEQAVNSALPTIHEFSN